MRLPTVLRAQLSVPPGFAPFPFDRAFAICGTRPIGCIQDTPFRRV